MVISMMMMIIIIIVIALNRQTTQTSMHRHSHMHTCTMFLSQPCRSLSCQSLISDKHESHLQRPSLVSD